MPNQRMIHYSIFENYQFSQLTEREKLIYIGLIVIADDEGRFKADPTYIKAKLFPYENGNEVARVSDVSRSLNKLKGLQLVRLWQHNGEQVGEHPNWKKYQKLRDERIKKSDIPPQNSAKCQSNISKDNISKDNISIATLVAKVRKDIEIIKLFATAKGFKFENPSQYSSFIKRNVRSARLLTGYSLEKIAGVMAWLQKNADFKWTLESVGKYIDENPNKIISQSKKVKNL